MISDSPNHPPAARLDSWLGFSCLFLGVPLLLAWFACLSLIETRRENLAQGFEARLGRHIAFLEANSDTSQYLLSVLREVEIRLFSHPQPEQALTGLKKHLNQRFPGTFEFTLLDDRGLPVPAACDFPVPRAFLQRFHSAYRRFMAGDTEALAYEKTFMQSFLGPYIPLGRQIHGQLHYVNSRLRRRYVYLSTPHPRGTLIVHLSAGKTWDSMAIRDRVISLNRQTRDFHFHLLDLTASATSEIPFGLSPEEFQASLNHMERSPLNVVRRSPWILMKRALFSKLFLIGGLRLPEKVPLQELKTSTALGLLLLFFFLTAFVQHFHQSGLGLSIRAKLVLAFSYTAGIPLLVMGISAHNYLGEREQVLENRHFLDVELQLTAFDGRFLQSITPLEQRLQKEFMQIVLTRPDSMDEFVSRVPELRKQLTWSMLKLFDETGKPTFGDFRERIAVGETKELGMFGKISASVLRNLNSPVDLADEEYLIEPANTEGPLEEVSGAELEWVYSRVTGVLGRLAPYDFGPSRFFLGLAPVFDHKEYARYLAVLIWSRKSLEEEYVRRSLLALERRLPDTTLFAFHRDQAHLSFPHPFRLARYGIPLARRTQSARQSARERVETTDGRMLGLGIRGRELSDFTLVALSSDREIRAELDEISWRFRTMAVLFLAISSMVGAILARQFLAPIQHLTEGVSALQERQFETRIPILDQDEFGNLSATFNSMIEGLEDLEVARVIQESLFPQAPVQSQGWEVFGSCMPATQVGGDYLDYFVLDGGRIAFVLGDVSGHGVSAALVMAMAKALIAHPATRFDPAEVLGTMQTVFLRILKRKKMMTCFFGVLDPAENRILAANAGQNFPFHILGGKRAIEIELPGKPLGVRNTKGFECVPLLLAPDDALVLYTDGLIEANDKRGESIGYDVTRNALPGLMGSSAVKTEQNIRKWHREMVQEGPQADDISLIIVQRIQSEGRGRE